MNKINEKKTSAELDRNLQKVIDEKNDTERFLKLVAPEYLGVYVVNRRNGLFRDVIGPDYFRKIVEDKNGSYVDALKVYKEQFVEEDCYATIDFVLDLDHVHEILESGETINVSYMKKDGMSVKLQIRSYSDKESEKDLSMWIYTNEYIRNKKQEAERQKQLSDALNLAKKTNDQLKVAIHQAKTEKRTLEKLCMDFVSMYAVEVNTGKFEILKLQKTTNAKTLVDHETYQHFNDYVKDYCKEYVIEEDKQACKEWFSCENLKERLSQEDRILFYFQSIPNKVGQKFFEAQAVKSYVDDSEFNVFIGLRYIDDLIVEEKQKQEILQYALDEANLKNEIISAIGKTYQYISRIDLENNYYEELTALNEFHQGDNRKGDPNENARRMSEARVDKEYQQAFLEFSDTSTLAERLKNKELIDFEYRIQNGDWHIMWFIVQRRNSLGNVTHVLCAIRGISKRKREEQKLILLADEARQDAAMKTRFLSNMSHDIRTPMNGIIGLLEKADHYPYDMAIQQECRNKMMDLSKSLVLMVNDILEMNKLETDDDNTLITTFDVTDLLRTANEEAQEKALKKGIDYVVEWEKGSYSQRYVMGNPYYCKRILQIISDNAIKFSEKGSSIHVWFNEEMIDEKTGRFSFVCQDHGIGMDADFVDQAFDIFAQEKQGSRAKYEGTGLGLSIAKKMAEQMHGKITLESKKGVGTLAIFSVPLRYAENVDILEEKDLTEVSLDGLRVLLVEDNEMNIEIAKYILEENKIDVDCAMNGKEGVMKFEQSSIGYYDVILMDILMPELNGLDATRTIRSLKRMDAKSIPIIAMSANTFAEDIMKSYIAGVNYYLPKPIDATKLITTIKKFMVKKKLVI